MSDEDKPAGPVKRRRKRRGAKPSSERTAEGSSSGSGNESAPASSAPSKSKRRRRSATKQDGQQRQEKKRDSSRSSPNRSERSGGRSERKHSGKQPGRATPASNHGSKREPSTATTSSAAAPYLSQNSEPSPVQEENWGDDSSAPTPDIQLSANLPANPPSADADPSTYNVKTSGYTGQLGARICNMIGVRFASAGRLYLYDAGDGYYQAGDKVLVESEHGQRVATVGAASSRRPPPRSLKRIVRRATSRDCEAVNDQTSTQTHLATAKAIAKERKLGIKVFRAKLEDGNKKLAVYYSCDDKTDVRPLTRALETQLKLRVDLRHVGVRDEAKLVGGIGSCGLELCCTTWLPSFVPVSIKHAKDQGLVLNPTKIAGQCGRLKCCLVYEQENYAQMRKGLPKLGKRVITNDGFEGRVIELDVLHQRIRVSVGRGESKVYKKGEVEPMFASQPQQQPKGEGGKKRKRRAPTESGAETATEANTPKQESPLVEQKAAEQKVETHAPTKEDNQ